MSNFSKLGLSAPTLEIIQQLGFDKPTAVQAQSIPLLLDHNPTDFIGLAQTGTGKTAAFGLPLVELIDDNDPSTQALIMAPTRELGQQTAKQLMDFSKNRKNLHCEVVYGGADIVKQIKALKRPTQIVIATPGRLLDLIKRKAIQLGNVKYVVLDEADEMLNMGFKEPIDEILAYTPEHRVTWLFSATMPAEIRKIVNKYMNEPKEVTINAEIKSNEDITHQYVITKTANKVPALRRFLDLQPDMRGILFCRTKRETQEIADLLNKEGYGAEALHGDLSQSQRDAAMRQFKTRGLQLLVATDVAARGIDVNDLTHVLHHTLPDQLESYTHRSGRTGRAGKKGISLAFINPREGRRIKELEKKIKVQFQHIEVPTIESLKANAIDHWASLIINTKVDKQADEILSQMHDQFAHLSKEDILRRLITTQLDHLMPKGGEDVNLNEATGGSPESRDTSQFHRYFINVGSMDGMTKADLVHLLSDSSGISRKFFGDITLKKNCAYFDVDAKYDKGLGQAFEGFEMDGRPIRVNRDDEIRPPKSKKKDRSSNKPPRKKSRREMRYSKGRRR